MSNRPWIRVDFVVIATFHGLVSKEVDLVVLYAIRTIRFRLNVLQAVRLVPAVRKDIEADLPANRVPAWEPR
jgi:hypothetical protein